MNPRLRDVPWGATYIGMSPRYVRGLITRGDLPVVRIGRRVLLDVRDLDALVDKLKAESTNEPNAALSAAAIKGWRQTPVRRTKGDVA